MIFCNQLRNGMGVGFRPKKSWQQRPALDLQQQSITRPQSSWLVIK
ncbi:Uncharacterised protein [Yersinia kristensenii]|nr:Uncharacterised protein [Yersinia kristensenii]CNH40535.1 Uncharacterised protein [Yersinia kristensenii]CNJ87535.1 Uncharacterised protein [Yersinia kristensenii]CNL57137.1 Uncharacterised protein [Yersinia kristensenii]